MLALALTIRFSLQPSRPQLSMKWTALMKSVGSLAREHSTLREAALLACLLFMTFSALWTTLVFLLRTPPYHYGTTAAGVFGLLGASSAAAAPIVGRMSDRHGPERSILIAIVSTLVGYVVLLFFGRTSPASSRASRSSTSACSPGHVANQSRIYSLGLRRAAASTPSTWWRSSSAARSGSYFGPLGFNFGGWTGFCAIPAGRARVRARLLHARGAEQRVGGREHDASEAIRIVRGKIRQERAHGLRPPPASE